MFLPIGDTPNPPRFTPYVNYALIGLNILIFALVTLPLSAQSASPADVGFDEYVRALGTRPGSAYDVFVFQHGFKPAAFAIDDLFFSMFLHGGFAHLAGNMLFLWIYGDNVEHFLGRGRYLVCYLVTGVIATVAFAIFSVESMVPLVGASGAISGVLGFYFLFFPRNKIKVFALLFPFFFDVILVPARIVLGFYVIFQNFIPILFGAAGNVAYGAHLGGFFGGLALAALAGKGGFEGRRRSKATSAPVFKSSSGDDSLGDLKSALAAERRAQAVAMGANLGPNRLGDLDLDERITLAEWMESLGQSALATSVLRQALAEHQTDRTAMSRIYLALGRARLQGGQTTAAYQHLMSAIELAPNSRSASEAQILLAQVPIYRRSN